MATWKRGDKWCCGMCGIGYWIEPRPGYGERGLCPECGLCFTHSTSWARARAHHQQPVRMSVTAEDLQHHGVEP